MIHEQRGPFSMHGEHYASEGYAARYLSDDSGLCLFVHDNGDATLYVPDAEDHSHGQGVSLDAAQVLELAAILDLAITPKYRNEVLDARRARP